MSGRGERVEVVQQQQQQRRRRRRRRRMQVHGQAVADNEKAVTDGRAGWWGTLRLSCVHCRVDARARGQQIKTLLN